MTAKSNDRENFHKIHVEDLIQINKKMKND